MNGIDIIKQFEGCKLTAYKCPAGIWTIGYGNTVYPDGKKVQPGDIIFQYQAESYLNDSVQKVRNQLNLLELKLNRNQFEALTSFIYNIGIGQFKTSTLYAKAIINPNDPKIANEFRRWNKAAGQVLQGLINRREAELELYFV
jgi:lysozyme